MHVDILTTNTVNAVFAAARDVKVTVNRKVEVDMRLILYPLASNLDLDVLPGD